MPLPSSATRKSATPEPRLRRQPELRAKVAALLQAHSQNFVETQGASSLPQPASNHPTAIEGKVVGPYIVRRELGRGGMGVVYLADDTRLSRRVALKALAPDMGHDSDRRERLRLEARAAAALSHPGIATVYALEEIGDDLHLAYECVPGEPLRALLTSGPLPIEQVVSIGAQLARALAAAHMIGVTHRDLKPENVMRTPSGVVKILDFGLARVEGAANPKLTQTGVIVGTPAYMAPEQVLGQNVDFRTDLFAFGLLIYELASGVNPFVANTMNGTFARIIEEEPPALSKVRPQSLPELDRIVATCLRKNPVERYDSTQDLVTDFEQLELDLAQLRQRASDRSGPRPAATVGAWRSAWWRTHQVIVVALYVVAVSLGWYVKEWVKVPVTVSVFIGLGAGAAIGGLLGGHLVFTQILQLAESGCSTSSRVARAIGSRRAHGLWARCRCGHAGCMAVDRDVDRGARDCHRTGCTRARAGHYEGGVRGYGCLVSVRPVVALAVAPQWANGLPLARSVSRVLSSVKASHSRVMLVTNGPMSHPSIRGMPRVAKSLRTAPSRSRNLQYE